MRKKEHEATRRPRNRVADAINRKEPRSDQAPGEEVVQVNDKYIGGGPAPKRYPLEDDQHRTGG